MGWWYSSLLIIIIIGNIWKVKYDQQADINTRLEMQLVEMNSQLEEIKNNDGKGV